MSTPTPPEPPTSETAQTPTAQTPTGQSPTGPTSTTPTPPGDPSASRSRWWPPRGRRGMGGAALLALLVVGAVAAALVADRDDGRRPHWSGPEVGLAGTEGELADLGGLDRWAGRPGPDGRGDGRGRGGRGAGLDRGLGGDTLLAGTVVSTADGSLVVTPDGGAARTIRIDDRTRVQGNGNGALGDLLPGERVVVRISGTGETATAVAITVPQARVTGTVTAMSADTATITAVDGLTVTADVAALGQKPAVGDLVVLTGVATNGTTLTADGIRILPTSRP